MSHADLGGWFLDAGSYRIFLAVWLGVALIYGLWRSRGTSKQDPHRPSGPIW